MFREIAQDYRSHKRAVIAQGFWALAFHRYGSTVRSVKFAPIRIPLKIVHFFLIKFSEVFFGIYIGANAKIGSRCVIEHFGSIIIHSEVRIGDDVRLRQGVTIGNKSADKPNEVPILGNGVDVGAGAKILGPVIIGEGAVIGANAVVVRDVPAGAIAVGVPASIKYRKTPDMANTPTAIEHQDR